MFDPVLIQVIKEAHTESAIEEAHRSVHSLVAEDAYVP